MDEIQEKIRSLQIYVPFLAKLIKMLEEDQANGAKLSQMKLLYNLLVKPADKSLTLDTLNKCEEVLSRVFDTADDDNYSFNKTLESQKGDNNDDSENEPNTDSTTCKESAVESLLNCNAPKNRDEAAGSLDQTESIQGPEILKSEAKLEAYDNGDEMPDVSISRQDIENASSSKQEYRKEESEGNKDTRSLEIKNGQASSAVVLTESKPDSSHQNSVNTGIGKTLETVERDTADKMPDVNIKNWDIENASSSKLEDGKEWNGNRQENGYIQNEEIKGGNNSVAECHEESDTASCQGVLTRSQENDSSNCVKSNTSITGSKEKSRIDSGEALSTGHNCEDVQASIETVDVFKPNEDKDSSIMEVATVSVCDFQKDNVDLQNSTDVDPLLDEADKGSENEVNINDDKIVEKAQDNEDEDDDDVMLIETRNSPICLDSDEDEDKESERNKDTYKEACNARNSEDELLTELRSFPFVQRNTMQNAKRVESKLRRQGLTAIREIQLGSKKGGGTETVYLVKKDPRTLFETIDLIESDDDDVILVSSSNSNTSSNVLPKRTLLPPGSRARQRTDVHRSNRTSASLKASPLKSDQSNFLNEFELQPAQKPDEPPKAFSAQISNKKLIIPNAFYGNSFRKEITRPSEGSPASLSKQRKEIIFLNKSIQSTTSFDDKSLKNISWLENFLANFANPKQKTSHYCYVLLQRVLNYKAFQKVKETRSNMNLMAHQAYSRNQPISEDVDVQMLLDLRNFFIKNDSLTENGKKFCTYATDSVCGRSIILTTDFETGDVTCRTIGLEELDAAELSTSEDAALDQTVEESFVITFPSEEEYRGSECRASTSGAAATIHRKRKSRGSKRDNESDDDYNPHSDVVVLPNIQEKRWSLRTRRTGRKDEELGYKEVTDIAQNFSDNSSNSDSSDHTNCRRSARKPGAKRVQDSSVKRLRVNDSNSVGTEDDLLTPTWIETIDDVQSSEDDHDEGTSIDHPLSEEINRELLALPSTGELKNKSPVIHIRSRFTEFCVLCKRKQRRIVQHYVNEHRESEVFVSRLESRDVDSLLANINVGFLHNYKYCLYQYAAHCIFCNKELKFVLSYWFDHFTIHTGEYSFECSSCGARKPSRALLKKHIDKECKGRGQIKRNYTFDTKTSQIEAHVCCLCNYIQLHWINIVKHLKTQHDLKAVNGAHIKKVILLQVSRSYNDQSTTDSMSASYDYTLENDNDTQAGETFGFQDDLSFMICDMLAVDSHADEVSE